MEGMEMKIVIVGHRGYIGPVLAKHLKSVYSEINIIGIDANWFMGSEAAEFPDDMFDLQIEKDVRDLSIEDISGADAVIQLAAVSNDPMGSEFEQPTDDINAGAAVRICKIADEAGVKSFVFASSCSMYGAGSDSPKTEDDTLNPLTAYARSKVRVEKELEAYNGEGIKITCLRFSTACGSSPMLRLDLVLNDFVASAIKLGKISVLSDGSPWRPLIHVEDMALAIDWAVNRTGNNYEYVNVGSDAWTWQIGELAKDVARVIGNVDVEINLDAAPDKRSYRVNFDKFKRLAPDYQPRKDFGQAVNELVLQCKILDLPEDIRSSEFIRLEKLRGHIEGGKLSSELRWIG